MGIWGVGGGYLKMEGGGGEFKGIVVSPFKVFKAHNALLALFMLKDKTIYSIDGIYCSL